MKHPDLSDPAARTGRDKGRKWYLAGPREDTLPRSCPPAPRDLKRTCHVSRDFQDFLLSRKSDTLYEERDQNCPHRPSLLDVGGFFEILFP